MKVVVSIKSKLPGHPAEVNVPLIKLGVPAPIAGMSETDKKRWKSRLEQALHRYMFDCWDEDFLVAGWRLEK